MARPALHVLTVALAIIGLGTVTKWAMSAVQGSSSRPDSVLTVSSPDNTFKAVLASWYGGGGISPYCYDRVFVVPAFTTADRAVAEGDVAFEGKCGTFELRDGRMANSPELSWREPKVLSIRFSIADTAASAANFHLRHLVAHQHIAVEFEVGH